MTGPVDIRPDHLRIVQDVLETHLPAGVKVWVFGSRAQWSAREGSDLDLALEMEGEAELDRRTMDAVADAFEDSDLPYGVDIVDLNQVSERFRTIVATHKVRLPIEVGQDKNRCQDDEWREVALGDLIEIKHGFAFKGAGIHDEPRGDILLTPGNFAIGGGFKADRFKYYDGHVPDEFVLNEGDLLVTMTDLSKQSDTLGYPALVPASPHGHRYLHNQRLGKIIPKGEQELCSRYIYYVMCGAAYRQEVLASATGTTVKHTAPERIKQYRFKLPTLPHQRATAHILGTLDDRIALNRRMNETLEEMARALFKSWFVDFDPVRAKMDGRWQRGESLPGLPAEFYDLFPERMVSSELGNIPAGWEVKTVGDLAAITGGSTPSTKTAEYWDGGTHCWATPKDLATLSVPVVLDTERKITDKGLNRIGSGLQPPGTVLLSSRAPIGYLAISEIPVAINQGFIAMQPKHGIPNLFLLHWCDGFLADILNYANGSTFLEVSKSSFRGIPIVEPSEPVLARYRELASSLHQKLVANEKSTRTLSTQRDSLLPQLMSGRLKAY